MKSSVSWVVLPLLLTVAIFPGAARAQYKSEANSILVIGNKIPLLTGADQFGRERSFESLKGAAATLLERPLGAGR